MYVICFSVSRRHQSCIAAQQNFVASVQHILKSETHVTNLRMQYEGMWPVTFESVAFWYIHRELCRAVRIKPVSVFSVLVLGSRHWNKPPEESSLRPGGDSWATNKGPAGAELQTFCKILLLPQGYVPATKGTAMKMSSASAVTGTFKD